MLVVPPGAAAAAADRVLARASQPGNADTIESLLAEAGTPNGTGYAAQRWEGEGGSVRDRT